MVSREGEEKKRDRDGLYSEGSNRERNKEKRYKGRENSQGKGEVSDNECYYCKKGYIQMLCKEFNEDINRVKNLRDGGRHKCESSVNTALGFVGDDDYEGALLVDRRVVHSKKWVNDSGCSFTFVVKKRKFISLEYMIRPYYLLNDEKVKVEGIREIEILTHGGVKRRLGDARFVPKFERNLISLDRLESKGYSFKENGRVLKVIRVSLVLIKDKRNKKNLYELQVGSGSLIQKIDDDFVCG